MPISTKDTIQGTITNANSVPWSGVTGKPSSYTPASHTHSYAGSASAGGSATSAVKLDTATAGSATQPVYFTGGKPVATTYTLGKSVPSDAVFTDHTYSAATQSAAGLMSADDKKKLDGVATGANAYSLPAATSSVLGGVKTGSNITNSSGTISLTKENVTSALGYTPPTTNTTYGAATTSSAGLMSKDDKIKLDGIATGATKITVDGSLSASSTNPVQNKVVYTKNLWLYSGTYKADGWTLITSTNLYTQTVGVLPVDGGPSLNGNMNLSAPQTASTSSPDTNRTLLKALSIINQGVIEAGARTVTIKTATKPTCDITVYWYAR